MTTHSKHTAEQVMVVINRLLAGESVKDISRSDGIPASTIKDWRRQYDTPKIAKLRYDQRMAFISVMETFTKVRLVMGSTPAMDYSQNTGGAGAQYAVSDFQHKLIDYQVDVDKAVRDTLNPAETSFYEENLLDKDFDMTNQSSTFMRLQEKLGAVFLQRGLYPASKYFTLTKG